MFGDAGCDRIKRASTLDASRDSHPFMDHLIPLDGFTHWNLAVDTFLNLVAPPVAAAL